VDLQALKEPYWAIVTDCLERFHSFSPWRALSASRNLRDVIESPRFQDAPPPGYSSELFYHSEPFYVACDIAERELDLDEHRAEYDELVRSRYAAAEALTRGPGVSTQYARV
jgi:hypothetical protein